MNSEKYRHKAIERFQNLQCILKENTIKKNEKKITEVEIIDEMGKYFDIKKMVFIIADDLCDGEKWGFQTALEKFMNGLGISIIICDEKQPL